FSLHLHGPLIVPCSVYSVAEARSVAESRSHPQQSMTSYHSQSRLRHARKVQVPPRWAHVSLKGFGHQRFDQRSLLADALRTATFAYRDLFFQFGKKISGKVGAPSGPAPGVSGLARLEAAGFRRPPIADSLAGHDLNALGVCAAAARSNP